MPDMEKVSKGLCDAIGIIHGYVPKRYWGYGEQACRDAIALLKEQEAVKPKKADDPEESEYCCGICGYPLWLDELYCAHCGRRIEWKGR